MITQKISFIAQGKTTEIPYYHREYKNDVKEVGPETENASWLHQAQRVGFLALPFLSLYKPFSFPISLGMGVVRIITNGSQLAQAIQAGENVNYELLQLAISVASLVGTLLAHPAGMIITTIHDLFIESGQLIHHLQAGDYPKAVESALSILSNALYLAAIGVGGIELHIASLAMQILLGIYHGYTEGQKGHFLEMFAHIAMAGIRGKQLHDQCKIFQMQKTFEQMVVKRSKQESEDNKSSHPLPSVRMSRDPNNKEQIQAELKKLGFDPLNMPKSGNTVLHQAVQKGNLRAVELALDYGFDVSSQNNGGDTALHIAAGKGNLEIAQYLVQRNGDIYSKNNLDQLPFHKGLKYDNMVSYFESLGYKREIPVREWAIAQGLRPDYVDSEGNTFLHRLVKNKHYEGLNYVFQEKFCLEQLDIENKKNFRPIDVAIEQKDRGSLQLFVTHFQGRYIHYKNIFQAAHVGWKEGLEMLLPFYDQKSLVDPKEALRQEVLKETAEMPAEVVLSYSVTFSPLWAENKNTVTPILGSIETYRERLLEEKYLNYQKTYPKTLLQEAVYSGDLDTVKLAVEYGCPINQANYSASQQQINKPLSFEAQGALAELDHFGTYRPQILQHGGSIDPVASPLALAQYFHPENQELLDYLRKLGATGSLIPSIKSTTMEKYFSTPSGFLNNNRYQHFGKKPKEL